MTITSSDLDKLEAELRAPTMPESLVKQRQARLQAARAIRFLRFEIARKDAAAIVKRGWEPPIADKTS
jgi:hypothetical protein